MFSTRFFSQESGRAFGDALYRQPANFDVDALDGALHRLFARIEAMTGWDFASPLALALAPAPLLAAIGLTARRSAPDGLLIPSALRDRFGARGGTSPRAPHGLALAWFAWLSIVVALAGPRIVAATPALPASGRDIMLALDLSGSMTKTDFLLDGAAASRLAVLKRMAFGTDPTPRRRPHRPRHLRGKRFRRRAAELRRRSRQPDAR